MTTHAQRHKYTRGCNCVFCKPCERPCGCEHCLGVPQKKFKITRLDFLDTLNPEYAGGNQPPAFLANRNPTSTMDMSWFWDGYVLKLEVGEYVDTDYRRITRVE